MTDKPVRIIIEKWSWFVCVWFLWSWIHSLTYDLYFVVTTFVTQDMSLFFSFKYGHLNDFHLFHTSFKSLFGNFNAKHMTKCIQLNRIILCCLSKSRMPMQICIANKCWFWIKYKLIKEIKLKNFIKNVFKSWIQTKY